VKKPKPEECFMKKCNLFYLSGLLFFLVAVLNLVTGENHSTAVVWLCLGSAFLCLGASQRKK
jgi:positive regulator of sigma E activity